MERGKGTVRKVRSDKKVDVKPTMSVELKNQLYTFSYLCELPVKDVAERLCEMATTSEYIIEDIRQWFRREYRFKNHITSGYLERPRLKLIFKGETGKVTIKFKQEAFDALSLLAFSLDLPPTTTATVLIKRTLFHREFMEQFIHSELRHLNDQQRNKVKLYLRQIWGFR
ncbi:hypothetical protein HMPREF1210_01112 [Paenisporosarcina sp. HGH0030]|uniref:hypothetical protein n=1 Tax=Paenisporosarcina sp. HGH0030 TaxID=1078085 RepID=UPI00034E1982|nr:hypothetical protein [Paenisporosarcina sp. HGH0030]EPD52732.1 hypothetical protein HMPREF1210_01112 [Paenisporosarcina sp. HGH0030]